VAQANHEVKIGMHFQRIGNNRRFSVHLVLVLKRGFLDEEKRRGGCVVTTANVKRSHKRVAQVKGSNFDGKAKSLIRYGI
jgi:hypothetical protein